MSLLLGALCGVAGGWIGLHAAGSSVQRTGAADARISITPSGDSRLVVDTSNPSGKLRFTPFSTPVAVHVELLRTDDTLIGRAAFGDAAARDTLVSDAQDGITKALIHSAIAALIGALALGLIVGAALALVTRNGAYVVGLAIPALLTCAILLAIGGLETRRTIDVDALSHPVCTLVPNVSVSSVLSSAVRGDRPSQRTIRALAIRAACSPGFAGELARVGSQGRALLG